MPTTLTSPSQTDPHLSDHGTGAPPAAPPPPEKYTGGNGDDGGDDHFDAAPQGSRGPRERLATARIGTASALGGVLLLFIGLISAFIVTKSSYHVDAYNRVINSWLPTTLPTIMWLNTAILFVSSATAEMARRSMFHEHNIMDEWFGLGKPTSRRASVWLGVTLALGMLFLIGQWVAWLQLRGQNVFYSGGSGAKFFYLMTATHALHLFFGITALIAGLSVLCSSRQFATRQIWVDSAVWYWHAMGLLWIALFILLEFFQ